MSALRGLLHEITTARGAVSLDEIARRIGVSRDEAEAMVGYWVRKGRLTVDDLSAGCPGGGCAGCGFAADSSTADSSSADSGAADAGGTGSRAGCTRPGTGPALLVIGVPPRRNGPNDPAGR